VLLRVGHSWSPTAPRPHCSCTLALPSPDCARTRSQVHSSLRRASRRHCSCRCARHYEDSSDLSIARGCLHCIVCLVSFAAMVERIDADCRCRAAGLAWGRCQRITGLEDRCSCEPYIPDTNDDPVSGASRPFSVYNPCTVPSVISHSETRARTLCPPYFHRRTVPASGLRLQQPAAAPPRPCPPPPSYGLAGLQAATSRCSLLTSLLRRSRSCAQRLAVLMCSLRRVGCPHQLTDGRFGTRGPVLTTGRCRRVPTTTHQFYQLKGALSFCGCRNWLSRCNLHL
jgi:hypothetical protein